MRKHTIIDLATHREAFVTVRAFADPLAVQDKTAMKWLKAGVLPAYKFKTEQRIMRVDAVAFVERARFHVLSVRRASVLSG